MKTIYEPTGRAGEYSELALNVYLACQHSCSYCFAPNILRKTQNEFEKVEPREGLIPALKKEVKKKKYKDEKRRILLSFLCDPYTPAEQDFQITRQAIEIMGEAGLKMQVLTKNGNLARRDFDLFKKYDVIFASTVSFCKERDIRIFEPNANSYEERKQAIIDAWNMGIKTWVSIEPIIRKDQVMQILYDLKKYVGHWKIGKINYNARIEKSIDWRNVLAGILQYLTRQGMSYYIKDELWKYADPRMREKYQKERGL